MYVFPGSARAVEEDERMEHRLCSVVGCDNEGRPQVCPFDGRYHHHGRIHYENEHGYPERFGFRFRDDGVWHRTCNAHLDAIRLALGQISEGELREVWGA